MTKAQGTIIILLLVAVVILLAGILFVGTTNVFLQNMWQFSSSMLGTGPTFDVTLESPDTITMGEEFDLILTLSNNAVEPIQLDSIDIDRSFLTGFEVISVSPQSSADTFTQVQHSWSFTETVPAGASLKATYRLKPIRNGRFAGSIEVYNATLDSSSAIAAIRVEDPSE